MLISVYIPPPEEEYSQYFKQRDKLTGNTKSAKKKLKHAQTKFLQARVKEMARDILVSYSVFI